MVTEAAAPKEAAANAVDTEEALKRSWEADAELGWILTGGNSDTSSLNAKLSYAKTQNKTVYHMRYETIRTEENDIETANKYLAELGLKWSLTEKNYFFATLLQEDDEFSQFDYQTTVALGYGRPVIVTDQYRLDLTIGPGYRYSKFNDVIDGEDSDGEGVLRLGAAFKANLSKVAKFSQTLTVDAGENQTISKSETALSTKMAERLAMKVSLKVRHNSEPLPGDANTDRETAMTLVYTW